MKKILLSETLQVETAKLASLDLSGNSFEVQKGAQAHTVAAV